MVTFSVLLFILVFVFSYMLYLFCKRVIYKLNRRVLSRNIAVLKNSKSVMDFEHLTEDEIREKVILPFLMILGYNTYDYREFERVKTRVNFYADYVVKKWYNSRLCKKPLYIKYLPFDDEFIDLQSKTFKERCFKDTCINELTDELYFGGEYYVLTNGLIYVFFTKKDADTKRFSYAVDLRKYTPNEAGKLAYFTKQYLSFEISDVYLA